MMVMSKSVNFSAYLIGENRLLIECAEILLARGHLIVGIISPLPEVELWASNKKIPYFRSFALAEKNLANAAFDYLFSIVNSKIIPDFLLKRANKFSINYHDSPLPRYAGVNATCWAILNNEKEHAITWHVINDVIDGGDILKQISIEIEENETAFSLNLKCYQAALSAFSVLADELAATSYSRKPQDFSKRTYYSFNKKPPGSGLISWNQSADEIDRLCRALNFGHYTNRIAVPKIEIENELFVVEDCQILQEKSKKSPGTLANISNDFLQISTTTNDILFRKITTLEGDDYSFCDLLNKYNLTVGAHLASPCAELLKTIEKISEECFKYEKFWVDELLNFQPASLPFLPKTISFTNKKYAPRLLHAFDLQATTFLRSEGNPSKNIHPAAIILTLFLIYLYRIGNQDSLGVGFKKYPFKKKYKNGAATFFSTHLPFFISLQGDMNFDNMVEMVEKKMMHLQKNAVFGRDIVRRYPSLSNCSKHPIITVLVTDKNTDVSWDEGLNSPVLLAISLDGKKISLFADDLLLQTEPYFAEMLTNIPEMLHVLLEDIIKNRQKKISQLSCITASERHKVLFGWNKTQASYFSDEGIVRLFQKQAREVPDAIAISQDGKFLTYRELNDRSNQFARYLKKNKLRFGSFVVVCSDHDLQLIISILSILKAGGVYIPIDPNFQQRNIQAILDDSKPRVILVKKIYENIINGIDEKRMLDILVVNIDDALSKAENEKKENLSKAPSAKDLAYIMYTSGTTGKPKGVMVPHCAIERLVKHTNYIRITPEDRITQAASISFDASTFEMWGALLNGACLVLVPHYILLSVTKFSNFLKKERITILWLTSALFDQYVSTHASMFKHLTYLLLGGDILNPDKVRMLLACSQGHPTYVLNGYGPTENTTFTSIYRLPTSLLNESAIPIGKPISNTTVYVLDDRCNPVPIGVPGELYVGGKGLSYGYLNNPTLTSEKFTSHVFDKNLESRLYKTGDIVRWLPDGNLDFLGRKDNQVKIRGFRVELEAIQACLSQHGNIGQCFVTVCIDEKHEKQLVAYIVAVPKQQTDIANIREFLSKRLPSYMVPSFFCLVEKLPLKESGKIDVKALPNCFFNGRGMQSNYAAPTNEVEEALSKIWSTLFSNERIGIQDDFFYLGGHSLLLTKLILELKEKFNFDLSVHSFVENPTISHLAELIGCEKHVEHQQKLVKKMLDDVVFCPTTKLPEAKKISKIHKCVLLTGATGFLGAHLLYDLYHLLDVKIYCLIRAKTIFQAKKYLEASFLKYNLEIKTDHRVVPILGDLSKPFLGLSNDVFLMLGREVDAIYHNGAYVHHLYSYEMLRDANVFGTVELLKLASLCKLKYFHYISTLSAVVENVSKGDGISEDFITSNNKMPPIHSGGYNQTKWVSECLLFKASKNGIPVKIYRPGWILGQSKTGIISADNNHLLLLIKGCIQLGYAPEWSVRLNILPVDFVSDLIVRLSVSKDACGSVFNLSNQHIITWVDFIGAVKRCGYKITLVSPKVWRSKYLTAVKKENALFSLLPLYMNKELDGVESLDRISDAENAHTKAFLEKHHLSYPIIDDILLKKYFSFLQGEKFFDLPA